MGRPSLVLVLEWRLGRETQVVADLFVLVQKTDPERFPSVDVCAGAQRGLDAAIPVVEAALQRLLPIEDAVLAVEEDVRAVGSRCRRHDAISVAARRAWSRSIRAEASRREMSPKEAPATRFASSSRAASSMPIVRAIPWMKFN